jgi:hypothetical protein
MKNRNGQSMSVHLVVTKALKSIGAILILGASMNAAAAIFGFGGDSWKEEVLLHDGSKIIVERMVQRGGRREVGQQPPIKEQSLAFDMPGGKQRVVWEDPFSQDIGTANFLPMLLDIHDAVAYLVVHPMGCLSYNKWGRPNPPYVVFRHEEKQWKRISLKDLPAGIKTPNLIFSSPDDEAKNAGQPVVSAEKIRSLYAGYRQPEFRSILREALPKERIVELCGDRVFYKGHWIVPNSPTARSIIDAKQK